MEHGKRALAVAAVQASAVELGLAAGTATVIHDSTKVALRLLPADVFVRVAPAEQADELRLEIELAQRFDTAGAPAVTLDARVEPQLYEADGVVFTYWTFHESQGQLSPARYADALGRLHAAQRELHVATPHFLDRVAQAEHLIANQDLSPALGNAERELLLDTYAGLRESIGRSEAKEQLLHGEPHAGNVLNTAQGALFIDLETACRGPVEFDLAHAPRAVSDHYEGIDQQLLTDCRQLVLAMVAAWRWDATDEFPNGLDHGRTMLQLLSTGPPWPTLDEL